MSQPMRLYSFIEVCARLTAIAIQTVQYWTVQHLVLHKSTTRVLYGQARQQRNDRMAIFGIQNLVHRICGSYH
jgi:hypothetical protein